LPIWLNDKILILFSTLKPYYELSISRVIFRTLVAKVLGN
jgi:hypothetical protein